MRTRVLFYIFLAFVNSSCSVARYASKGNVPNLTVTLETDLNVPLAHSDVMVDIFLVRPDCEEDFQGRLYFDNKKEIVGIPTGKILEIQTRFITTGWGGGGSDLSYGTLFNAKPGIKYLMEVIYRNKIFSADIFELTATGKKSVQLERIPPNHCAEIMGIK